MEEALVKTIIIYDQIYDNVQFIVVDGDKSHLDGVYINSEHELEDELYELLYVSEGTLKQVSLSAFPVDVVKNTPEVHVIIAGFL